MLFICYYLKTKNISSIRNVFLGQKKSFEWFSLLRMPQFRCILASYCSYARHIYTISGITPCPGKPSEPSSATSQNTFWLYSSPPALAWIPITAMLMRQGYRLGYPPHYPPRTQTMNLEWVVVKKPSHALLGWREWNHWFGLKIVSHQRGLHPWEGQGATERKWDEGTVMG